MSPEAPGNLVALDISSDGAAFTCRVERYDPIRTSMQDFCESAGTPSSDAAPFEIGEPMSRAARVRRPSESPRPLGVPVRHARFFVDGSDSGRAIYCRFFAVRDSRSQ